MRATRWLRRFCTELERPQFQNGVVATAGWKAHALSAMDFGLLFDPHSKKLGGPEGEHIHDGIHNYLHGGRDEESQKILRKMICAGNVTRTKFIDDVIANFVGKQIVILGAGMDTRAWRLPKLHGVTVYEIDFPELFELKRERLGDVKPLCTYRQIGTDLTERRWDKSLKKRGFNQREPSLFIVEDIFMYLDEEEVDYIIERISELSWPGSLMTGNFLHEVQFKVKISDELHKTQEFLSLYNTAWISHSTPPIWKRMLIREGWGNMRFEDSHSLNKKYLRGEADEMYRSYIKQNRFQVFRYGFRVLWAKLRKKIKDAGGINQTFVAEKIEVGRGYD